MGVGPLLPWGSAQGATLGRLLLPGTVAGLLMVGALGLSGLRGVTALVTFGLAFFVLVSHATRLVVDVRRTRSASAVSPVRATARTLLSQRRTYGGLLVHLGFVLAAVAVAASSTYASSSTARLTVGQTVASGDWTATLEAVRSVEGARRDSVVADLRLRHEGRNVGVYQPMLSTYPQLQQAIGTPSVRTTATEDAYLVLTEIDPETSVATVRLAVNPMVLWLWIAVGVMVAGGVAAGWPRRRRTGTSEALPQVAPTVIEQRQPVREVV
jgi:cytochrome c-type biogenesis protein CcmF